MISLIAKSYNNKLQQSTDEDEHGSAKIPETQDLLICQHSSSMLITCQGFTSLTQNLYKEI
uniref:Uncharacterized protein n=1 Tax=Kalanchoe fedtschenkoi TaxID=63787 RepID=A0A7N1A848_KALFE